MGPQTSGAQDIGRLHCQDGFSLWCGIAAAGAPHGLCEQLRQTTDFPGAKKILVYDSNSGECSAWSWDKC